jgi:hypothetical protein
MKRFAVLAVVACLCACALAGTGRADYIINTPSGLAPGDKFDVVFLASGHNTAFWSGSYALSLLFPAANVPGNTPVPLVLEVKFPEGNFAHASRAARR